MVDIWAISDTHFGHNNIIKYCNRPYSSVKDMNEALLEGWNSRVKDGDTVIHAGDVYFTGLSHQQYIGVQTFLSQLKGNKKLILGNHDHGKDKILTTIFQRIDSWYAMRHEGLLFSHYPLHPQSLFIGDPKEKKSLINVHGHTHDRLVLAPDSRPDKRYKNISVECIDYLPVHIDELIAYAKKHSHLTQG